MVIFVAELEVGLQIEIKAELDVVFEVGLTSCPMAVVSFDPKDAEVEQVAFIVNVTGPT